MTAYEHYALYIAIGAFLAPLTVNALIVGRFITGICMQNVAVLCNDDLQIRSQKGTCFSFSFVV